MCEKQKGKDMIRIKISEKVKKMTLEELGIQIEQGTISPDVEIQSYRSRNI
jgi:hypothetical protein